MGPAEETNFVSVDDYLSAEEMAVTRSEYIDGWVRAMSGSTIRHNTVTLNCTSSLLTKLRGKPCQPHNSDTKLRIRRHTNSRFYYPDAQVVCDSNPATSVFQDNPVLIIEVLSPTTRAL
ncbi:MAG: Uma2 family endonuclease [Pirellulaceae bacterium]|nr:Uma2 family endonuclease [Pirellulaceae bacterium]